MTLVELLTRDQRHALRRFASLTRIKAGLWIDL